MPVTVTRCIKLRGECHILFFSGVIALVSVLGTFASSDHVIAGVPEIAVPLVISVVLGLFSYRINEGGYDSAYTMGMARYGWLGALVSIAISGWWLVIHYSHGMPIVGLPEQILTLVSGGILAGILFGYAQTDHDVLDYGEDRERLQTETSWVTRSRRDPILNAVVEALAELEDCDPLDLPPVHDYFDVELFSELRTQKDSRWRLSFTTESYLVCVDSIGTVAVYDTESTDARSVKVSMESVRADGEPSFL